jgi:hypothetical protein
VPSALGVQPLAWLAAEVFEGSRGESRDGKEVIEQLTDDVDGSEADHTVLIGWEGEWRGIDLSQKNIDALAKVFDRYWEAARKHHSGATTARGRRRQAVQQQRRGERDFDMAQLREWAAVNVSPCPNGGAYQAPWSTSTRRPAGGR